MTEFINFAELIGKLPQEQPPIINNGARLYEFATEHAAGLGDDMAPHDLGRIVAREAAYARDKLAQRRIAADSSVRYSKIGSKGYGHAPAWEALEFEDKTVVLLGAAGRVFHGFDTHKQTTSRRMSLFTRGGILLDHTGDIHTPDALGDHTLPKVRVALANLLLKPRRKQD